ncbi:hypothetical protein GQ42DRAFT_159799, partial [Ramicandelaber brevisporus]
MARHTNRKDAAAAAAAAAAATAAGAVAAGDARDASTTIVPFHVPKHILEIDDTGGFYGFLSMFAAMISIVLRSKYAAWVAVFAALFAWANDRGITVPKDRQSGNIPTIMFAIMALVAGYLSVLLPPPKM